MAARCSGPRFLPSNGTMHQAARFGWAKTSAAPQAGRAAFRTINNSSWQTIRNLMGQKNGGINREGKQRIKRSQ
jgi:hypothetical protein